MPNGAHEIKIENLEDDMREVKKDMKEMKTEINEVKCSVRQISTDIGWIKKFVFTALSIGGAVVTAVLVAIAKGWIG